MAWTEVWSHKVDGTELNDIVNFLTEVPQVDDDSAWNIKSVPIDGTVPAFIRADPTPQTFTFNIQMTACTSATYYSRLATLKAIFTPGVRHTYTRQVRGDPSATSVQIVPIGRLVNVKQRQVVFTCHVPVPGFA